MTSFDRIEIGQCDELGLHHFEPDEVARFVANFDPLAARGASGREVSPWHVAAVFMRLNVAFQRQGRDLAFGPSPGVSNLVWHRPVQAGETLRYRQTVRTKRRSAQRSDWGVLTTHIEARDEAGLVVFSMTGRVLVRTD